MGVGYFKAYARTSLNAVCVFVCLVFYQRIVMDWFGLIALGLLMVCSLVLLGQLLNLDMLDNKYLLLLMAGILLFFVIAVSQRVSRTIAGGE